MRTISLLPIFLTVIVLGTCCTPQPRLSENQMFEFSSGGAHHPQGFGEWRVRLDAAGVFSIAHNVRDEVKDYGAFTLTEGENSELWELIRAANGEISLRWFPRRRLLLSNLLRCPLAGPRTPT